MTWRKIGGGNITSGPGTKAAVPREAEQLAAGFLPGVREQVVAEQAGLKQVSGSPLALPRRGRRPESGTAQRHRDGTSSAIGSGPVG